jgi:CCR4-NOT transcriptional complex subunit CAF120
MPSSDSRGSNKFIELEEPQTRLIQAFAPHGLLQAGMQDKQDRSAKRQEELAREMGASLVNVPSKPPAPSAGLLGAVAQHERERKNAGGIGATLTDREREKRLAVSLGYFGGQGLS